MSIKQLTVHECDMCGKTVERDENNPSIGFHPLGGWYTISRIPVNVYNDIELNRDFCCLECLKEYLRKEDNEQG